MNYMSQEETMSQMTSDNKDLIKVVNNEQSRPNTLQNQINNKKKNFDQISEYSQKDRISVKSSNNKFKITNKNYSLKPINNVSQKMVMDQQAQAIKEEEEADFWEKQHLTYLNKIE